MRIQAVIFLVFTSVLTNGISTEGTTAVDVSLSPGNTVPKPIHSEHFASLLSSSPFRRTLNLSETFALRGIAEIEGKPVATLYNRASKKSVMVSSVSPNDEGIKLVEIVPGGDLTGVAARISFSGEEVELKFDPERIAPAPENTSRPGDGGNNGGKRPGDGKRKGPSKQDMERYKSLTEAQREKFRSYIRQTMQKYPNLSREERGNMIRGALSRLSDGGELNLDSKSPSPAGKSPSNR